MAAVSKMLIDLLLLLIGAAIIFAIITPIVFSFRGDGYRCQMSVSLASMGFSSNALNCRIAEVQVPQSVVDQEQIALFLAHEMLECRRIYSTDRSEPLRNPQWVNLKTALPRAVTGQLPEGFLMEPDFQPWTAINPFKKQDEKKQLCSICSIVRFPQDASLEDFRIELAADGYGSKTFDDLLYERGTPRYEYYFQRNSDRFLPVSGDNATAIIFYTERSEKNKDNQMLGIVAMNHTDFYHMISSDDYKTNLCQEYLS